MTNRPDFCAAVKEIIIGMAGKIVSLKVRSAGWLAKLRKVRIREKIRKVWKNFAPEIRKIRPLKSVKKLLRKFSGSWKIVIGCLGSFMFFYYFLGAALTENIDAVTMYKLPPQKTDKSEMVNAMSFLLNREIDEKMWTPNLPAVFPASILDNMPNFQVGIIKAICDNVSRMRKFMPVTLSQATDLKTALELLRYPPNVWLMSRKGTFGLAPSSNAQYRKARKELQKFNHDGNFAATQQNFTVYLEKLSGSLQKLIQKNEEHIQEHSSDVFDFESDNRFYFSLGYAFSVKQIAEAASLDFKEIILQNDVYTEWTYLLSSLQKIVNFNPYIVRNAELDSQTAPNHLIVQNYFLQRALVAIMQMRIALTKSNEHGV